MVFIIMSVGIFQNWNNMEHVNIIVTGVWVAMDAACDSIFSKDMESGFWRAYACREWILASKTRWHHRGGHCTKHWPGWSSGMQSSTPFMMMMMRELTSHTTFCLYRWLCSTLGDKQVWHKWIQVMSKVLCAIFLSFNTSTKIHVSY